jgi:FtsP/CotA-like multicopper oxidase with cupredoxin domain
VTRETKQKHLKIYGQELNRTTYNLARMNMIIHDFPTARIEQGNTLSDPKFKDEIGAGLRTYDYVVANPPFSVKTWTVGMTPDRDPYQRFAWGIPPAKQGDYAFLLHNFALHPGTRRPDPAVMQDFDLWTFNSKVFPAIEPIVARTGERVRIRVGGQESAPEVHHG